MPTYPENEKEAIGYQLVTYFCKGSLISFWSLIFFVAYHIEAHQIFVLSPFAYFYTDLMSCACRHVQSAQKQSLDAYPASITELHEYAGGRESEFSPF